ncbi:paraquat-inducible protein A [Endozoicomonas elysicola]|uniref:Paraquat-inducible protein A n=1 Tax=Endozoicomonas elysicola TaxID=305900 RepID=A0A081KH07_9GAMM|nr:paraquat-inducible protein A [Endozoicomonas elysicola]KEI73433.1 paraquat-inducible protein A [Endozoicomonas elysicola]
MNGIDLGLKLCLVCYLACPESQKRCYRCGGRVRMRRQNSIARCWALTLAAALLYIPANTLPMMSISWLGQGGEPDTIMSGVIKLIENDMLMIAAVVFIASILIPLLKLLGMAVLLLSIQSGYEMGLGIRQKIRLYRVISWIGRWSMLDIFIISLLAGLIQFGQLGQVEPGAGAWAFAAVVTLTMLASNSFDPRLLWDNQRLSQRVEKSDCTGGAAE